MQALNPSTGAVVAERPVQLFDPAQNRWDAADDPADGFSHGPRVLAENLAAELGQAPDELTAQIMAQRPDLITIDFGGRAWVPERLLQNVRKSNLDRLAAAAIPADREPGDVATQDNDRAGTGGDDDDRG
jgi:hypothetical protein